MNPPSPNLFPTKQLICAADQDTATKPLRTPKPTTRPPITALMRYLSPPPVTFAPMSCVEIPEPVQRLLKALSERQGMPAALLDQDAVTLAADNGWVYEHQGLVGLTGTGAYHVGKERGGGLLG